MDKIKSLDKDVLVLDGFDNSKRRRPVSDFSKHKSFSDTRGLFTEEELLRETERCIGCGATIVDTYLCVGCGQCTTKCKFEAISLERVYDGEGVEFEKLKPVVLKQMIKRKVKITAKKMKGAVGGGGKE